MRISWYTCMYVWGQTSCEINGETTPPMRPTIEQDANPMLRSGVGYTSDVIM